VRSPINRHRFPQLAADLVIVVTAWWLAFRLRFDEFLPVYYEYYLSWELLGLVAAIKLTVFALFGFYNRWWRYVSTRDMWGAARGVVAASLVMFLVFSFFDVHAAEVPRTVWVIDGLLTLALVAGSRMLARTIIERPQSRSIVARGKEVIVVGAGDAAQLMLKEMLRTPALGYTPIGLVDDDPRKRNMRLHGIRVLGTTDELAHILRDRRPDEVLIAIPSASGGQRARIVEIAREEHVAVKTLPGLHELISGDLDLANQIRPVEVEDLLGREPVEVDVDAIASYVQGKTVLVTGAGGSIGSELCRQLARAEPQRIVMYDQAESALFEIERELVDERRFNACVPVLADVRDRRRLREVFERYRPDVVFHAAAYKHVPLMEANPLVSVANNVLGTRNVADAAIAAGVERFVLISTDKALNPFSVYGQTKTLCEWIVGSHGERDDVPTKFVAVRFGNVLNSAGSVIPLFRRQIERGGPVTVTDPEMTRFFMTIPEAVALVIQAGAIGGRGRILVLDMGEPIRILDLARNMIRLSGKEPDVDVPISFIGARPGEKIHEELFAEGETWKPTTHPKIVALDVSPVDRAWLEEKLDELERLVEAGDTLELVGRLAAIVREPGVAAEPEAGAAVATPALAPSAASRARPAEPGPAGG
jgi:FlaA1/EpsC-like NDP-sugar epimerase